MAKTLQFRRDTTANLAAVTGAVGEIFIDTTKDTVVVMDGATAGGFPLQGELTAGSGIDITAGTISATGGGSSYGDANVGAYLTTYTGNIGNVSTTANVVTTQYFIGNGSQLTGIVSGGSSSNSFETITVAGQTDVVADSGTDTLTLAAGSGISITTDAGADTITIATTGGGGSSNSFETITVAGQTDVVADSSTDTLTLAAGSGISITTDAGADTITIAATGAANTGDFTFVGGNISLPDFQDATVNVHGNITVSTTTSSTTTYTRGEGDWDGSRSMVWNGTTLYYSDSSSNSVFGQTLAADIPAGTSITLVSDMYGTKTLVTTTAFAFDNMDMRWEATVTEYTMSMVSYQSLSFGTSTTTESTSEQDFTYTFSQTGEFISDSALLGDVLISDNILTLLPLISNDSYATETEQPLIINGDLEILGNVADLTVTGLFVSQQSAETVANVTATASGSNGVPLDFNSGAIFHFNSRATSVSSVNFTNIPKVAGQVVTVTVLIKQDSSGFVPSTFYINNTDVTSSIYWSGGNAPTATASTIDLLSFSIMWVSGTTYTIFASATNYATA